VLSNHYHLVVLAEADASVLRPFVATLHRTSATALNLLDGQPERRVWYQFWDTRITSSRAYFARLKYVHRNPERHGLVADATDYPWCSAWWFAHHAPPALRRTVDSFAIDRVQVPEPTEETLSR
jgi:putative transposase